MKKRLMCFVLAACMVLTCFVTSSITFSAVDKTKTNVSAKSDKVKSGAGYGLASKIQDGTILHCFDWKYNDIKAELKSIAEAGFTAVQTSPAQQSDSSGTWYWLYQPLGFYIGSTDLGNKSQLQALCTEAKKYGIKVIVDVVANHLSGDHSRIQNELKDGQYWHTYGGVSNWADRYQVINGEIGMPDLKTEHSYVQNTVKNYLNELKGVGVEGFRFDAAKHIGLPSEGDNFFSMVKSTGVYSYGEILVGPDDRSPDQNRGLMSEYTNYISVTDSVYGKTLRDSFNSGNAPSSNGHWSNYGCSPGKLVYWGESHDTWSNGKDWGYSNEMSQNTIDRAYCVAASRASATALYFSRPSSSNKESIKAGQKGSTAFKSKEVAAVNHFHNAMIGQKEYYLSDNNCAVNCRETGAVIVAGRGGNFDVTVKNGGNLVKPGTYIDEVTGSKWTVTSSSISGHIGSSGIAVVYNPKPAGPSVSISYNGSDAGGSFYGTASVTLNATSTSSQTYTLGNAGAKSYKDGDTITIGSNMAEGQSVTLTLTGKGTDGTSVTGKYTFTKKKQPTVSGTTTVYFDNSSANWSNVYAYVYRNEGEQVNSEWPGVKMQKLEDNIWGYAVDSSWADAYVIFNNNEGSQSDTGKGHPINKGEAKIYQNSSWNTYVKSDSQTPATQTPVVQPTTRTPSSSSEVYGDTNADGYLNVKDVTLIQKHIVRLSTLNGDALAKGDVNSDGFVNIKDATCIQWYLVKNTGLSGRTGTAYKKTTPVTPTQAPVQSTTSAPVVVQPTTKAPVVSSNVTIYFSQPGDWGGTPVARCFSNDYSSHKDITMQSVGSNKFKVTISSSYTKVEFRNADGNQWTQWFEIRDNGEYSK